MNHSFFDILLISIVIFLAIMFVVGFYMILTPPKSKAMNKVGKRRNK